MAEAVKVALDPRRQASSTGSRPHARRARAIFQAASRPSDQGLRRAPHAPDRLRRRSFETGSARPLDFGHWSAHKLEQLTHNGVDHGEAVAIGIALDTRYSVLSGRLAAGRGRARGSLLQTAWFQPCGTTSSAARLARARPLVLKGLADFQEHLGGELTVTLLADIGRGVEVHEMDEELIGQLIDWLEQRNVTADETRPASRRRSSDLLHEHPCRRELAGYSGKP